MEKHVTARTNRRAATNLATITAALLLSACAAQPPTQPPPATVTQHETQQVTVTQSPAQPASAPPTQTQTGTRATVKSVHDGDTFTLTTGDKVRVLGIDAPEIPPAGNDCGGQEAADKAKAVLDGQTVTLQADPQQGDKDQYGRLLRYVQTDAGDFAALMLTGGYVRVYAKYPVARTPDYQDIQTKAQQDGAGLWTACPND